MSSHLAEPGRTDGAFVGRQHERGSLLAQAAQVRAGHPRTDRSYPGCVMRAASPGTRSGSARRSSTCSARCSQRGPCRSSSTTPSGPIARRSRRSASRSGDCRPPGADPHGVPERLAERSPGRIPPAARGRPRRLGPGSRARFLVDPRSGVTDGRRPPLVAFSRPTRVRPWGKRGGRWHVGPPSAPRARMRPITPGRRKCIPVGHSRSSCRSASRRRNARIDWAQTQGGT